MNFEDTHKAFEEAQVEVGSPLAILETAKDFQTTTGKRGGERIYTVSNDSVPPRVTIAFRGKPVKLIVRAIYQALGEVLWPTLAREKILWYGVVMSQTRSVPTGVTRPEWGKTRGELLKLSLAQAKRRS